MSAVSLHYGPHYLTPGTGTETRWTVSSRNHVEFSLLCSYKPNRQFHRLHEPTSKPLSSSSSSFHHFNSRSSDIENDRELSFHTFYQLSYDHVFALNRFIFLFKSCRELSAIKEGKQLHGQAIKRGLYVDVFVQRALIRMYAKCGECENASKVFDRCTETDIISQNDLILGYVRIGELDVARQIFDGMVEKNVVSWSVMVDGYSKYGQIEVAQQLFDEMPERNQFSWTSIISGYLRCGLVEVAQRLFDRMPERNVVAWTIMVSGYTRNSCFKEALELFLQMQKSGLVPNRITLISILPAISELGALSQGRWIHAYVERKGLKLDGVLGSALVDMHSKCGCIDEAVEVFEKLKIKELSAWNSIILGLASHGRGKDALCIFSRMQGDSSVTPNEITFIGVLSACSHSGLVNEGCRMFNLFTEFYKVKPNIRHYGCMVDLLGRAGFLKEAKEFIEKIPMKPNLVIWKTLLGACRIHKNAELAEDILRIVMDEFGSKDSGFYSLLSNVFAEAENWDDMGKVRKEMNDLKVQKVAGCSWVEVDGVVHEFLMGGERFHGCREEIHLLVDNMESLIRREMGLQ